MASDESKQNPIELRLSAKATARFEVKTEIPATSSGRFVDSIVDMFRPFSESRGLLADNIRLQREDVLIEIAKKAKARALLENIEICAVPTKFLVPFLEKASLEKPNSELVDRWSDLLLSASHNAGLPPRFISVLADLNFREATILKKIAISSRNEAILHWFVEAYLNYDERRMERELRPALKQKFKSTDSVFEYILNSLEKPGGIITHIFFEKEYDLEAAYSHELVDGEFDSVCSILQSLGLVRSSKLQAEYPATGDLTVYFVHLTHFGSEFLIACDRELACLVGEGEIKPS